MLYKDKMKIKEDAAKTLKLVLCCVFLLSVVICLIITILSYVIPIAE